MLAAVPLDLLQFHGDEPPELCRAFGRPYLKAIAVGGEARGSRFARIRSPLRRCRGLLFDAPPAGGLPGGTGRTFDWVALPKELAAAGRAVRAG